MQQQHHPVHSVYDGLFNARSGTIINLAAPEPDMIHIEDIAAALSKICRFGGHSSGFYSVAQHSVLVSRMAPEGLRLAGLLHDASEAYLGDVIKPLKVMLGEVYENLEIDFMNCVMQRYGLDRHQLREVKAFDELALEVEFETLIRPAGITTIPGVPMWHFTARTHGMRPSLLPPYEAEQLFLNEYRGIMSAQLGAAAIA